MPEQPSHKGITYVHVIEPPPERPKPPPGRQIDIPDIPYDLPTSIMSHAYKPTWRVQ